MPESTDFMGFFTEKALTLGILQYIKNLSDS